MASEITSTGDMAEAEWDGESEPQDAPSDMVATRDAEGKGIEFHVSMRDYTMRDMEALIIEAAAMQIVGRGRETQIAKAIEARAIEMISEKATAKLEAVTAEIIDQPMTPKFGEKTPVTMRDFLGLFGREFLTENVDSSGKPVERSAYRSDRSERRVEYLVRRYLEGTFQKEIQASTTAVVAEIRAELMAKHTAMLATEKKRFADALAALVPK